MLTIVRRAGQAIVMYPAGRNGGVEIKVHIVHVGGKSVELGIVAPMSIRVLREEIIGHDNDYDARHALTRRNKKAGLHDANVDGASRKRGNG